MLLGFVFCTLFLWREKTSKALLFRGQRGGFLKFPTQCGGSTKWRPAEEIQKFFFRRFGGGTRILVIKSVS